MQLGNFIDVFLAVQVSGTYGHHQDHQMLSCSMWFCAPSLWMGGGLDSGSQDHHPSTNSVHKTTCCNSTSNAPDDGRMYLKLVQLRIHQ